MFFVYGSNKNSKQLITFVYDAESLQEYYLFGSVKIMLKDEIFITEDLEITLEYLTQLLKIKGNKEITEL